MRRRRSSEFSVSSMPTRFNAVAVCSGHMIDLPTRAAPRFPAAQEATVRAKMAMAIDGWKLGAGDLAICGGARGADILFAELCLERGATVRLLVSLDDAEFREQALRLPGDDAWERRFDRLVERGAQALRRREHLGEPPPGVTPFAQTNKWMLDTALAEATRPIRAILVWDGNDLGDGPGGTAHFASELARIGCTPVIIDPGAG